MARRDFEFLKDPFPADLRERMERDPVFRAQEEARQARAAERRRAETPLREALKSVGVSIESIWDLVNTRARYPEAIPILLEHLRRPYPDASREGIGRALAVREAKFAWPILVDLFLHESFPRAKRGMAVALAGIADDSVLTEVVALVRDRSLGLDRAFLLGALERSKDPSAHVVLGSLVDDPELALGAAEALRRIERRVTRQRRKK